MGQLCNMDPKTLVTHSWFHTVEESQGVIRSEGSDVEVGDSGDHLGQSRELMEVCCKQTE